VVYEGCAQSAVIPVDGFRSSVCAGLLIVIVRGYASVGRCSGEVNRKDFVDIVKANLSVHLKLHRALRAAQVFALHEIAVL
jgi:hypothetical protein